VTVPHQLAAVAHCDEHPRLRARSSASTGLHFEAAHRGHNTYRRVASQTRIADAGVRPAARSASVPAARARAGLLRSSRVRRRGRCRRRGGADGPDSTARISTVFFVERLLHALGHAELVVDCTPVGYPGGDEYAFVDLFD